MAVYVLVPKIWLFVNVIFADGTGLLLASLTKPVTLPLPRYTTFMFTSSLTFIMLPPVLPRSPFAPVAFTVKLPTGIISKLNWLFASVFALL